MVSPVDNPTIRKDEDGEGHFGARRKGKTITDSDGNQIVQRRKHVGLDLWNKKGDSVKSPITGTVKRIGFTKADRKMKIIWLNVKGGYEVGLYYVTPTGSDGKAMIKPGGKVVAGQIIGIAQDVAKYYNSTLMKNHVHLKIKKGGRIIDPTPWFKKWTMK
jgi:murein DD-endopeptidase MepM/ murein hydrolase activator NlpD